MQSALYKELYSPHGQVVPMVVWAVRLARGCGLVRFAIGHVCSVAYYCSLCRFALF